MLKAGCAIAIGLGARGEKLGFSTKTTRFCSLGLAGVLPGGAPLPLGGPDSCLGIFLEC